MEYNFAKLVLNKAKNKVVLRNGKVVVPMVKEEPIVLPANTLRFRFSDSNTDPTAVATSSSRGTWTKVNDSEYNDWNWTLNDSNWHNPFSNDVQTQWGIRKETYLTASLDPDIRVIAAGDTSSVTVMSSLFAGSTGLTSVVNFDTSNVTNISGMFNGSHISAINHFQTIDQVASITDIDCAFYNAQYVLTGMYEAYLNLATRNQQLVDADEGDMLYYWTFLLCGKNCSNRDMVPTNWRTLEGEQYWFDVEE